MDGFPNNPFRSPRPQSTMWSGPVGPINYAPNHQCNLCSARLGIRWHCLRALLPEFGGIAQPLEKQSAGLLVCASGNVLRPVTQIDPLGPKANLGRIWPQINPCHSGNISSPTEGQQFMPLRQYFVTDPRGPRLRRRIRARNRIPTSTSSSYDF